MRPPDDLAITLAIPTGALLVITGIAAYAITAFASITALIPAIFGAGFIGLGVIGRTPPRQRIAAAGIGLLAALGALGSIRAIPDLITALTGGAVDSLIATATQGVMLLVCLILLASVLWRAAN